MGVTEGPQLSVRAALKRSLLACPEIHCSYLNTKVEAAQTHFSSYTRGKSESECQVACLLFKR